ncbi:MAG: glucose-6-phosphate isomerase [Candidatus Heimdallarchaeota archaeon]|nr:glucose-6-phosphate isomerase [Candidatus Heimdallarchaeota archaeon]
MKAIDLSKYVPYKLLVDKQTKKITKAGEIDLEYSTRKLLDMKEVLYDQEWLASQQENPDLYYMYRNLIREEDKDLYGNQNIRFDITIIPPRNLGKERVKTAGHFHPEIKENYSYPEAYEVMAGKGLYLLQKETKKEEAIEVIIIKAKAGDQVLIPPGYGHITINPSESETLIMNNLVSSKFSSIYEPIKERQGAAYLYLKDGQWIKNPQYHKEVLVQKREAKKINQKPFYLSFLQKSEEWLFLNKPWEKNWD